MQAVDYLRVMNKHNKFASYFASLQGSGSNDLGLQGGSNINAMWSSELAARCVLTHVCLYGLMKLFFNSQTQSEHMTMGGGLQIIYKLTIRPKCINAIATKKEFRLFTFQIEML